MERPQDNNSLVSGSKKDLLEDELRDDEPLVDDAIKIVESGLPSGREPIITTAKQDSSEEKPAVVPKLEQSKLVKLPSSDKMTDRSSSVNPSESLKTPNLEAIKQSLLQE